MRLGGAPVGAAAAVLVCAAVAVRGPLRAHSSMADEPPLPPEVMVLSRMLLPLMYQAQPRGRVGSATVPSYVFPAAAAAAWHAGTSTIRADDEGQSLLLSRPHVYPPAAAPQGIGLH